MNKKRVWSMAVLAFVGLAAVGGIVFTAVVGNDFGRLPLAGIMGTGKISGPDAVNPVAGRDTTPIPTAPGSDNKNISALLEYPMDKKSDFQLPEDTDEIQKTAEGFFTVNYNIDFRDLEGIKEKLLYYFSASSNGDFWVERRISDIEKYSIVSQGKFITAPQLVYVDQDYEVRVRGRLLVKYGKETAGAYLAEMGLEPDVWYYRDLELLLTLAVDNGMWERGKWTYLGCRYLSQYTKIPGGIG